MPYWNDSLVAGEDYVLVTGDELSSGNVLIGECNGRCTVYESAMSSAMPGLLAVETEFGFLYLDPDEWFRIVP